MKKILFSLLAATILVACQKNNDTLDGTNSNRIQKEKEELSKELVASKQGWKVKYQPNQKKYGGFTFLMKFNENGNVVMSSDAPVGSEQEIGLYQIVSKQTLALSFTTKNHIHRLADAFVEGGNIGVGFEGEFDFLYFGKEEDKLKFKTQKNQNVVYFEKANEDDWQKIDKLAPKIDKITRDSFWHFVRVTAPDGTQTDYGIDIAQRYLTIKNFQNPSENYSVGLIPIDEGFELNPALEIHGKKFTKLVYDAENQKYIANQDGVVVELLFSTEKPESLLTDDYKDIESIQSYVFITDYLGGSNFISPEFVDLLVVDGFESFSRIDIGIYPQYRAIVVEIQYPFAEKAQSVWSVFNYKLKNKRLYLTRRNNQVSKSDEEVWNKQENKPLLDRASQILDVFGVAGEEYGFFVEKKKEKIAVPNVIYTLRSEKNTNYYLPFYAIYR